MATYSSTFAWRIPWTEEPGGCSPWGDIESDTTEQLTLSIKCALLCCLQCYIFPSVFWPPSDHSETWQRYILILLFKIGFISE